MTPDTTNERRQGQNQDLTTKSDELLPLVLDNSVRERFRQQCKLFYDQRQSWWQANDAYEAALKPCSEKVSNLVFEKVRRVARMQQLVKQHLQKSPEYRRLEKTEKRYIEKKAKANEELKKAEAKLQSPGPCPDEWLEVPAAQCQPRHVSDIMEYMFPDDDPGIPKETMRLRAYVLLTIVHDHALKSEVSLIADDEVWPRDDDAVPEPEAPTPAQAMKDFALSVWKNMEAYPSWSCVAIDRALCVVQADLAQQNLSGQTNAERKSDWKPLAVSLWDDIPKEYRDAIEQYREMAKAAKKEHKRVKIALFCVEQDIDEVLFRAHFKQVQMREKRQASQK